MRKSNHKRPSYIYLSLGLGLSGLILTLVLAQVTDMDLWISSFFYEGHWWIDQQYEGLFYQAPTYLIAGIALISLSQIIKSWIANFSRKQAAALFLSLTLIPLSIAGLKDITDTECPRATKVFGGPYAYTHLFDPKPVEEQNKRPAKCFPAGHASGGYALIILFFILPFPWNLWGGLTALSLGSLMADYQMLRGAHFLSHSLATLFIAVILSSLIAWIFYEKPTPRI